MNAIVFVIAALLAWWAYRDVERFRARWGRGPWGGSPRVWAFVCFLIGIIGVLLLLIAKRNTKKQLQANANWIAPPSANPSYTPPQQYGQLPPPPAAPPTTEWTPPPPPPSWTPPEPPAWSPGPDSSGHDPSRGSNN